MAAKLWKAGPAEFSAVRDRGASILRDCGPPALAAAEARMWGELPAAVAGRSPPHLSRDEMVELGRWKIGLRGKTRPGLLAKIAALKADDIKSATTAGLAKLAAGRRGGQPAAADAVAAALDAVSALYGVGPATASAVLALADDSCPFMSDEALAVVLDRKPRYDKKEYALVRTALVDKAQQLNEAAGSGSGGGGGGGAEWTAGLVERCLFLAQLEANPRAGGGKGGKAKGGGGGGGKGGEKRAAAADGGGGGKRKKA